MQPLPRPGRSPDRPPGRGRHGRPHRVGNSLLTHSQSPQIVADVAIVRAASALPQFRAEALETGRQIHTPGLEQLWAFSYLDELDHGPAVQIVVS